MREKTTIRLEGLTAVAASFAVVFVLLAASVALHPHPLGIESAAERALFASQGTFTFRLFHVITITGSMAFVAAGAAVLSVECWRHSRDLRLTVGCIVAPGLAGVAEIALKPIVGRPRPSTSILTGESGFGFPSGHAAGATALAVCAIAVACALLAPGPLRVAAICTATGYALLIGASRVVVGAHHLGDVLGGWMLGIAIATGVFAFLRPPTLTRHLGDRSAETLGGVAGREGGPGRAS